MYDKSLYFASFSGVCSVNPTMIIYVTYKEYCVKNNLNLSVTVYSSSMSCILCCLDEKCGS